MNQFPLRTFQENHSDQNRQNRSPLKVSSKHNMESGRNSKIERQACKESPKSAENELLQKTLKSYEDTISKQKIQIQSLKAQIKSNHQYTSALEQKYTILLQSIQPFDEKINVEILVEKISELEGRFQAIQRGQVETTSFKFLKLTQKSTSISTGQICSQTFDELISVSEKCIAPNHDSNSLNGLAKSLSKVEVAVTAQIAPSKKQEKSRKQSTDSEIGIQVSFLDDPIKKHNIERFISLESELKNNEINLSRKRKNSEFEENLSSVWEKHVNEFLANDEGLNGKFRHKTEHLLKKGIPYELRSTVWPMIHENQLGITWQFYMQLLERREKGWVDESVKIQIQKDMNRSFTGKGKQLENKDKLIDQVQQVLQLFHLYRPDVSYVQGMTYPAIILTTVVGKMRAFCIFANQIIGIPFFKRLYTFEGHYPKIYCKTFDYLLKDVNSGAYDILQKKHISSEVFLVEWFYTFFSRGLNFETTLKIWDHMAYVGEIAIFKLAVTVIELVSGYLTDATTQGGMGLIKEFSSYIDEKKLMEAFLNSRVTEDKYKKAFKKAFKSLNS